MREFVQNLRHGVRIYAKTPVLAILVVLALGIGIGASTTVFSVVDAILIQPLPYAQANRIVIPWRQAPAQLNLGYKEIPWGIHAFNVIRQNTRLFKSVGAFKADTFNFTGMDQPALLDGLRASSGFLPALGVSPFLGRAFTAEEDQEGHEHEVVLSYPLWSDRFGADRNILGRVIDLNGSAYTVIGVMPPHFVFPRGDEMPGSFDFPREAQLWVPLALPLTPRPDAPSDLAVVGRLMDGVSLKQSQAEMDAITRQLETETPQLKGWFNSLVTPLTSQVIGDTKTPLLLLLCAVGGVLLITCTNVAGLLLARSLGRRREFALRAALGAEKRRLIVQLMTESLVLAFAGGIIGIGLAAAGVSLVKVFGPLDIPRLQETTLNLRVCSFAVFATLLTGIGFGLVPAFASSGKNLMGALREGDNRAIGGSGKKTRDALLVLEIAVALILVVSTGLLSRTFFSLLRVDAGFDPTRVLTFEVALPATKYQDVDRAVALYRNLLQQLNALSGVEHVGVVAAVPMDGSTESTMIRIPDHPPANNNERPFSSYTVASPGYFSAVGTPLLQGRDFAETDTVNSVPVAVINRAMANKFWSGENPVGKQVALGSPRYPTMTIIGIVSDVKRLSLREQPGPEMYVPYSQKVYPSLLMMHVVVRTRNEPMSMTSNIRDVIHSIDPDLPMAKLTTLTTLVQNSMAQPRFSMLLLSVFSFIALLLACTGIYAAISSSIQEREQEIGIRMALGAQRGQVFQMILGYGARLAAWGMGLGLILSLVVCRAMASYLYGVKTTDPLTFIGVPILLSLVALLACYIPARRVMRINPLEALRYK
jgi:predicted permease